MLEESMIMNFFLPSEGASIHAAGAIVVIAAAFLVWLRVKVGMGRQNK